MTPLQLVDPYDYCIIGGGVMGCAIGKTLLEQHPDASIVIVEKNTAAGQGNTIRSNAAYRNIFDTELNIQLAASSIKYYHDMEEQGEDFGRRQIGYLFLLTAEQYEQYNTAKLDYSDEVISFFEFLDCHDIAYEIYTQDQLQVMFPELVLEPSSDVANLIGAKPITYGFLGKQCGNFSPDLVVQHYLRHYLNAGGEIRYQTRVESLKLGNPAAAFDPDYIPKVWEEMEIKAIEVSHQGNTSFIRAEQFIVATGAWINELLDPLGIQSLVKAKKRQLFTVEQVGDFISNHQFPNDHSIFPFVILPTGGVFLKPKGEAKSVVIGTSDVIGRRFEPTYPLNQSTFSNLDNPQAESDFYLYNILPVLQSYFPSVFDEYTQFKGTAGFYAYSVDKYPVIDRALSNLVMVSGASGSGIMKADSIARIAVALVLQEQYAQLYNGFEIEVSRFGIKHRDLPDETLVL